MYVYWVVCILGCMYIGFCGALYGALRGGLCARPRHSPGRRRGAGRGGPWPPMCRSGRSAQGATDRGVQGAHLNPHGPLFEPPGPLLTHLHTVCMACSECLPTGLNPLAERTLFPPGSAGRWTARAGSWARPRARSVGPRGPQRAPPRLDGDTHRAVKERCLGLLW